MEDINFGNLCNQDFVAAIAVIAVYAFALVVGMLIGA
jgi:hypothetical protein